MADLIIPNAKKVAAKSATLWTGYIGIALILVDYGVKYLKSDASVGLSPDAKVWLLGITTTLGIILRFWQQNLSAPPDDTTTKE
jgi:hypothetical protein